MRSVPPWGEARRQTHPLWSWVGFTNGHDPCEGCAEIGQIRPLHDEVVRGTSWGTIRVRGTLKEMGWGLRVKTPGGAVDRAYDARSV